MNEMQCIDLSATRFLCTILYVWVCVRAYFMKQTNFYYFIYISDIRIKEESDLVKLAVRYFKHGPVFLFLFLVSVWSCVLHAPILLFVSSIHLETVWSSFCS